MQLFTFLEGCLHKGMNSYPIHVLPTRRPVMGPQSQINEENACSIPSVCKKKKMQKKV